MSDKPKQLERFTMLEPMEPNNPSSEELASRIVDVALDQHFTMLEPMEMREPTPEELAMWTKAQKQSPTDVPDNVLKLVAQLTDTIDALDEAKRQAALKHVSAELSKRLAG